MSFFIKYQGAEVIIDGSSWVDHIMIVLLLGAFLVKSPVFMVHGWLPKAHVEAPVAGSIMLAGVLLKFGGYGCVLVFFYFVPFRSAVIDWLIRLVVWGGFLCSLICLRQVDVKAMIAYSSIGHISMCVRGFIRCYSLGWRGGLLLMVAHGLCSAGLFALAGYLYKLFSSRRLLLCKGVLRVIPSISLR